MTTETTVLGYHVKNSNGTYLIRNGYHHAIWRLEGTPEPISLSDAYALVSLFIAQNPSSVDLPEIVKVTKERVLTPLECASRELGDLLVSLTERHGLDLWRTHLRSVQEPLWHVRHQPRHPDEWQRSGSDEEDHRRGHCAGRRG